MIQVYADGSLVYDSRVPAQALLGLTVTRGLNKGGTASILMPPTHPAFNSFISYRTVVEIIRSGRSVFRGRALYPADDTQLRRTITCEGERCFLRDGTHRPYLYQSDPATIFTEVIERYNAEVDAFKRFKVGSITVTDPNGYIRLESEEAETYGDTVDKLVERCGGYIVFTTNAAGERVINWLAEQNRRSTQLIEFGENLLDFARTSANTDLATRIVPYGAKNDTTGKRLTITSVNGGIDYVEDAAAVALRGVVSKAVYWDDVTTPEALLTKARQYLADSKNIITTLELTAIDLSVLGNNIDSFEVGDLIEVRSAPHGVNGDLYQLNEQTLDLLRPKNDKITLGKNIASLTGADVLAGRKTSSDIQKVEQSVRASYQLNTAEVIKQSEVKMTSLIKQESDQIKLEVSRLAVTDEAVTEKISTSITQFADSITLEASGTLGGTAQIKLNVNGETREQSLDLSAVRQAFANDASAVSISAGTITFNSGTLIINSTNLQVDAAGKITATDAVIYGDIITIDGSFKTELDKGSIRLYYSDALCGTINTKYWSGAATEGISLRIEDGGKYIMFSHPSNAGTGYDVDYYLNYGWSSNYSEKHIFQTSARFLSDVYLDGKTDIGSLRLRGAGGKRYLVTANDNGTVTCSVL